MFKQFFLEEKNMLWAIVLNAVIITLLYFPELAHNPWLIEIDHFFIILFLIEAVVKIRHFKPAGYFKSGWNKFDFALVIVSLPSLLAYFLPLPNTSFLKILRLLRLIRLVRFVQFIPRMSIIVAGLARALKASLFVLAALFLLNFLLALFTCHFYGHMVPEYFGNPLIASYSIFQMFTVEGWNEIPAAVAEKSSSDFLAGISRFYFVLVVLAGGIFGMSLANAVFVDEMTADNNDAIESKIDELKTELQELKTLLKNR